MYTSSGLYNRTTMRAVDNLILDITHKFFENSVEVENEDKSKTEHWTHERECKENFVNQIKSVKSIVDYITG